MLQILTSPKTIKILFVVVTVGIVCRFCYSAGVNAATNDFQDEKLELIAQQDEQLKEAIKKAKEQQKRESQIVIDQLKQEEKIVETIRYVEREIPDATFNCDNLGDDFLRLFNQAIPE